MLFVLDKPLLHPWRINSLDILFWEDRVHGLGPAPWIQLVRDFL